MSGGPPPSPSDGAAARAVHLLGPPTAALCDHFWLHSPIASGQLVGLGLVTVGAAMVVRSLKQETQ